MTLPGEPVEPVYIICSIGWLVVRDKCWHRHDLGFGGDTTPPWLVSANCSCHRQATHSPLVSSTAAQEVVDAFTGYLDVESIPIRVGWRDPESIYVRAITLDNYLYGFLNFIALDFLRIRANFEPELHPYLHWDLLAAWSDRYVRAKHYPFTP